MITPEEKKRYHIKLFIIVLTSALVILSAAIFISSRIASQGGITVEFTTRVLDKDDNSAQNYLVAGKDAIITFKLIDSNTGQLISGQNPEVTFSSLETGESVSEHRHFTPYSGTKSELGLPKIQLFVLNSERGTIAIQGTSEVIKLKGGKVSDMVAGRFGDYVYVTLLNESQVAVVDAISHEVVKYIDVSTMPGGMFLQPESRYLWVSSVGSVSIIDTDSNILAKTIKTGRGYHQVAFSPENAYITNSGSDTVTVIRLSDLEKQRDIDVQRAPYGIDYSNVSDEVYIANILAGTVTIIDARTNKIKEHIPLSKGIEMIRFSPNGRQGVVLNQHANVAYIIDPVNGSLHKTVLTGEAPNDIVFMNEYALIRDTYSPDLTYIKLDEDISNNAVVGSGPSLTWMPHSLITTPYGDEVVVTSPREGRIWFIHEMFDEVIRFIRPMAMGSANVEYGSDALTVVESKLHETDPGVYRQYIKLDRTGTYDIKFRTQKINANFKIEVLSDQTLADQKTGAAVFIVNASAKYTRIQDAIDNASAGDTILVSNGTYYENVYVNKPLILRGIGMPVVDAGGRGSAITLSAEDSTLEGFMAKGASAGQAGISVNSNNNIIRNNSASNNLFGIWIGFSSNNTLSNNMMTGNKYNFGFDVWNEDVYYNNSIDTSNRVDGKPIYYLQDVSDKAFSEDSDAGIFYCINCNNITVRNVTLKNNLYGIFLWKTNNSKVEYINASNNLVGISLYFSKNNTLCSNIANSNEEEGISLLSSNNNTLCGNSVSGNSFGIKLSVSSNNMLNGNTASNNSGHGIFLQTFSGSNMLSNNDASNNGKGISLTSSSNNTLGGNTVNSNRWDGISLYSSRSVILDVGGRIVGRYLYPSRNNMLNGNDVHLNGWEGVSSDPSDNNMLGNNNVSDNYHNPYLFFSTDNSTSGNG